MLKNELFFEKLKFLLQVYQTIFAETIIVLLFQVNSFFRCQRYFEALTLGNRTRLTFK